MGDRRMDADLFADLALDLHAEDGVEDTVDRVLTFARDAVAADYAGVIFVHKRGRTETVAATDPIIEKLDKIQMDIGEGPDVTALEDAVSIIVDDAMTDTRWPAWAERVADAGIRSLLNVRLSTSDRLIGTLNLYGRRPGQFDADDQAVAQIMARHASVAIGAARVQEGLWQAVDARKVIGQAQGILMERYRLDEERAFAVLLRYSQDHNIKLRLVAEELIGSRRLPGFADQQSAAD